MSNPGGIYTTMTNESNIGVIYITEEGNIQTSYSVSNPTIYQNVVYSYALGTDGSNLLFAYAYVDGDDVNSISNSNYFTSIVRTTDGSNWSSNISNGINFGETPSYLAWNGSKWLLQTFINNTDSLPTNYIYISIDGITWTSTGYSNNYNSPKARGIPGLFYLLLPAYISQSNVGLITSLDGITWTPNTSMYNTLLPFTLSNYVSILDIQYNGNTWLVFVMLNQIDPPYEYSFYTLTSSNLSTWVMSSNLFDQLRGTITIGVNSNLFVAGAQSRVGDATFLSQIFYSSNTSNWIASTSLDYLNTGGEIRKILWNGSSWLAFGQSESGKIAFYYSSDAVIWTGFPINSSNISATTFNQENVVTFFPSTTTPLSSNIMVFAENSGLEIPRPTKMLYSTDGLNFQDSGYFVGYTINFIETNGSSILVSHRITSGESLLSMTSNGSDWSDVFTLGAGSYVLSAAWNGSKWFIITYTTSNDSYSGYTSTNGVSWSSVPYSNAFQDMAIVRGIPGLFVGVRYSGYSVSASDGLLQTSSDGINWTPNTSLNSLGGLFDLQYNGNMWLLCSSTNNIYSVNTYTSTNLSNWVTSTDIRTSAPMANLSSIAWNSNLWVIGGGGGNGIVPDQLAYSSDGSNWTAASSLRTLHSNGYIFKVIWNGSHWVASGTDNLSYSKSYYSSDAITWEEFPINSNLINGSGLITSFYYPYENSNASSNAVVYTYASALSNAVPSDSVEKAAYFAALTNNFISYSSSTAVTVTSSNLVNYYRSQGSTIPLNNPIRFLPTNSSRVIAQSVITSLSNGDYIIFPDNYTITIDSKTYRATGNNLIITTGGVPATIAPNGSFTVYNKIIRFLTASSPGLGEVTGTAASFTYASALASAVPSNSNDKAAYFTALNNNFSNYSSSIAVTVTSSNSSNLVNYYRTLAPSIPVGTALRFLPTNSSRVVSQAVITSLAVGDYVMFPDNYTLIISGKTYAISSNSITITASGQTSNVAPGGEFIIYNKTLEFITAGSTGVTVVTASASNSNPPCFLEGTKILCLVNEEEQYITIESLTKGTLVKTKAGGYKAVTHLGYSIMSNSATRERNQLFVCTPDKYPTLTEPLYITGCHSILVDELTEKQREDTINLYGRVFETEVTYRLEAYLDDRADPWHETGEFTVWHVALEHEKERWNWGVYANGLLVESISNHSILTSKTLSLIF